MTQTQISRDSSDADALKPTVNALYAAMCADYGDKFIAQFRGAGISPNAWKWRVHTLLTGVEPAHIVDGYEEARKNSGSWPPTVSDIVDAAKNIAKNTQREARESESARSRALLPPPNKLGLDRIREGAAKIGSEAGSEADLAEAIHRHEALISAHRAMGKIHMPPVDGSKLCAVPECRRLGSLTRSTVGSGSWYCRNHFRL